MTAPCSAVEEQSESDWERAPPLRRHTLGLSSGMTRHKFIITLLVFAFGTYVLTVVSTDLVYYARLPRVAVSATGQTYRLIVCHGSVRYASEKQLHFRQTLLHVAPLPIVGFFVALVLGLKWGELKMAK